MGTCDGCGRDDGAAYCDECAAPTEMDRLRAALAQQTARADAAERERDAARLASRDVIAATSGLEADLSDACAEVTTLRERVEAEREYRAATRPRNVDREGYDRGMVEAYDRRLAAARARLLAAGGEP